MAGQKLIGDKAGQYGTGIIPALIMGMDTRESFDKSNW